MAHKSRIRSKPRYALVVLPSILLVAKSAQFRSLLVCRRLIGVAIEFRPVEHQYTTDSTPQSQHTCVIPGLKMTKPITARKAACQKSATFVPLVSSQRRGNSLINGFLETVTLHFAT